MKPLTPSDMGKLSHKAQVKKYGGKKGYRAEMKRRVMCRIAKVAGATLLIALFFQPFRITYTLAQTEPLAIRIEPKTLIAHITRYSSYESCHFPVKEGCLTASGQIAQVGMAACPNNIPFGTSVKILDKYYTCTDRYAQWLNDVREFPTFDIFEGYGKDAHDKAIQEGITLAKVTIY